MDQLVVELVDDPAALVGSSHLFDQPVTAGGAADFLDRQGHLLLLARTSDGHGVGFVSGVEMRHPDKDPEMFVYELGVDDEWRRRGVATTLLRALRDEARRRGCRGMWTGTEADNVPALATYRSLGATVDDRSVFVVWDDPDGAVDPDQRPSTAQTGQVDGQRGEHVTGSPRPTPVHGSLLRRRC